MPRFHIAFLGEEEHMSVRCQTQLLFLIQWYGYFYGKVLKAEILGVDGNIEK